MARFNHIQNSFLSGEISPRLEGRTDLIQYQHSLRRMRNFLPLIQGGATLRPGGAFSRDLSGDTALLSFGEQDIVFLRDGSISRLGGGGSFFFRGRASAYSISEIDDVKSLQLGDLLYLVHPNKEPQYVVAGLVGGPLSTEVVSFYLTLDEKALTVDPDNSSRFPFVPNTITTNTIGWTGSLTVGSTGTLTSSSFNFQPGHTGTIWRFNNGAVRVTSIILVPTTTVGAEVIHELSAVTATDAFDEQAWSNVRGWPRAIISHNGRLFLGGTFSQPDTIWGSATFNFFKLSEAHSSGAFEVFDPTNPANPFAFTINSDEVSEIQWLQSHQDLAISTKGAEYISNELDSTAVNISSETAFGSAFVQPVRVANRIIFVEASEQRIREFIFDDTSNNFLSRNLNVLADHFLKEEAKNPDDFRPPAFRRITYQRSEDLLWTIDDNGNLFSATVEAEQNVLAWSRHTLGGNLDGGSPKVRSIAVAKSGNNDTLFMTVERTVDGSTVFYLEQINRPYFFEDLTNLSNSITDKPLYMDSGAVVRLGSPGKVFPGFVHLANETVSVLADGQLIKGLVVSAGGTITLGDQDQDATEVVAGLPFRGLMESQRIDAGSLVGSAQGSLKRVDRGVIRFHQTIGAKFGGSLTQLEDIPFRKDLNDQEIPLFTGDKKIDFPQDWDREARIFVVQDDPFPCTVLSFIVRGITND